MNNNENAIVYNNGTSADNMNDIKSLDGKLFASMLCGGASQLRAKAEEVNNLNVFPVPDGDTGDNMSMTIEGGVIAIKDIETDDLSVVADKMSQGMLLGARGNSGVILSQFFAGISKGIGNAQIADVALFSEALKCGVKQAYAAVMKPTEGTILTVARESVEYAVARVDENSTFLSLFEDLMSEMHRSLDHTPELLAQLKEAGVVDSGGAGFLYIMDGCQRILKGEEIDSIAESLMQNKAQTIDFSAFTADSEMTYGYCTELLLQLQNSKVDTDAFSENTIKDFLVTVGDSIVAFKTGSIIKIHVHTKTPEKVLEFCRQFGEFLTVKIENMSVQHSSEEKKSEPKAKRRVDKDFATIAVASGDGIEKLFYELGVDYVVRGGQTQNPSAQDFVEAFESVEASNIFVFPNNSNIIMAANQSASLYKDANIYVIESKDIGMGYSAISAMNYQSGDPKQICETFIGAMAAVSTGFISTAVRDATLGGVNIENGDFIGFVGKEMRVSTKSMLESAKNLLSTMLNDDTYLVTAFIGKQATAEDVAILEEFICDNYPDIEFYSFDGGQDVYPLIFVVE